MMESQSEQDESSTNLTELRTAAIAVLKKLVIAGHIAYFAGGCVRDRLLGHDPTDYDIATSAIPADVAAIFPRVQRVGESFGVMLVRHKSHMIQVATFRTEGVYSDGRHPDTVQFSDAQHDASRRDFTINGLFENPLTGEVIDHVGGQKDLERKVIRAIGDPHARLREDRLRMLRAVRFAAKFGFSIDPETADAIRTGSSALEGISRERIGQEIKRMLSDPNRAVAAWELQTLGLDAPVLLEPSARPAITRLSQLPDDVPYATALAAWLLDRHIGDPSALHPRAKKWADALMLSNEDRDAMMATFQIYMALTGTWMRLGIAAQKRLAATAGFEQALVLLQATDRTQFIEVRQRVAELYKGGISPEPLINGSDLIGLGLPPGPMFSRVLDAVYDAQLEGTVQSRPQALKMAEAVAATFGNG